jgi:hypothetical protein
MQPSCQFSWLGALAATTVVAWLEPAITFNFLFVTSGVPVISATGRGANFCTTFAAA